MSEAEYLPRYSIRRDLKALWYALLLHGLIALTLLVNFYWPSHNNRHVENVIKARVVLDKKQASQPAAKKRPAPEIDRRKQQELARQKKLQQEKARQAAIKKKKQAEKKKKLEAQRRAADKRRQEQAQQDFQKALEAEERERAAQANEARAMAAMSEFEGLIRQQITRNWNQPSGVPSGLSCLVRVRLAPGGHLLSVSIVKSSGNALFDRSVENAVEKAAPLPVPEDPQLFNYVRELNIRFDPED